MTKFNPRIGQSVVYSGGGINWTWYAHITIHEDGTATVDREYRLHNYDDGPAHPKAKGHYMINESKGGRPRKGETFPRRYAIGVIINDIHLYPLKGGKVERWDVGKNKGEGA